MLGRSGRGRVRGDEGRLGYCLRRSGLLCLGYAEGERLSKGQSVEGGRRSHWGVRGSRGRERRAIRWPLEPSWMLIRGIAKSLTGSPVEGGRVRREEKGLTDRQTDRQYTLSRRGRKHHEGRSIHDVCFGPEPGKYRGAMRGERSLVIWFMLCGLVSPAPVEAYLWQSPVTTMTILEPTGSRIRILQERGLYKWDKNGFLIHFLRDERNPLIRIYTREGRLVCRISPIDDIPEVQEMVLDDIALSKKGAVFVAVTALNAKYQLASALLQYDMDGVLRRIIKTDPFAVDKIAVDDENNIWLLGYDWKKFHRDTGWALIRKISFTGVPLASALPRGLFPKEIDPLRRQEPRPSEPSLEVVGDKVYAWLPGAGQLFVLSLDGRIIRVGKGQESVSDRFRSECKLCRNSLPCFSVAGPIVHSGPWLSARREDPI